jgi:chaperonin GroES
MNLEPLGDRIVVKPTAKEEVTKGGIVLPDTVKEKPQEGEVIAVGPGRMTEEGKRIALDVKKGDTVVYPRYSGTELKIEGEEYLIMRESEVLAKKG